MSSSKRPVPHRAGPPPRRGAASLVVVMILFFIITLVAAYTSRNLLFEQRTSTNQYRATLAFEAADAGLEWAIARLNEGRMNDDCTELDPATPVGAQPSFRERYLDINGDTGLITSRLQTTVPAPPAEPERIAGCVFDGTNWVCHCPDSGNPVLAVPTGNGPFPAFWVKFRHSQLGSPQRPRIVRIQVNACTRSEAACLDFKREAQSGDGLATVWAMVALRSAIVSAPTAALTVRGTFGPVTGTPEVTNTDATAGGITINGGGAIGTGGIVLTSLPGTPAALSIHPSDSSLALPNLTITPATPANTGENRMFNSIFGTWPEAYLAQPGVVQVLCASGCTATEVNNAVTRHPGRTVHVSGGGTLVVDATVGTAAAPVALVADGQIHLAGGAAIHGIVYSRSDPGWDLQGDGEIRGAAVAERNFAFAGANPRITYHREVLTRVQNLNGTFTKVAGSWRDFQPGPNP